jgi:hypothetical protein
MTGHSDRFAAVALTGTAVIAIGRAASYVMTTSQEVFGYGWIARLAPADGGTLSSLTFGDQGSSSGFNAGYLAGSNLHVGGWSQQEISGGPFRASWSALDLTNSPGATVDLRPAQARPGEAPPRGTTRSRHAP